MAENSHIAWTRHTFNPWMGCVKVSDGCKNCYAETLLTGRMGKKNLWGPAKTTTRQVTSDANWRKPLKWNAEAQAEGKAVRVFAASLADVFEDHPIANATRPEFFDLVARTPFIHWLILTKRIENVEAMLPADWHDGYGNVWLGTSIEDMRVAHRADVLRSIPAAVRFVSYEPALGPLDEMSLDRIDWIIYGGESGPNYRYGDPAWARSLRDRCAASVVAHEFSPDGYTGTRFFFKQASAFKPGTGTLDGETPREYPWPRWTRNYTDEVKRAYLAAAFADRSAAP